MPRNCIRAHVYLVAVTNQPGGYPGLQSWPQKRRVSKEGLGAALAEAAPASFWHNHWLKVPSLAPPRRVHVYGKGEAGNRHLKLHFKPFSCQALNAANPLLAENLVIPHGSETGWARAAPGHGVGLHHPFKYLLSCVKIKYRWDWEMHLGSLSGG